MIKLLNSDFARLGMSRIFRIGILASAIVGILGPIVAHINKIYDTLNSILRGKNLLNVYDYYLDYHFFHYYCIVALIIILFCCYYVGVEYNSGTFRNKIAAGHSRNEVYLSMFLTNAVSGCILYSAYLITDLCVGLPLLGTFQYYDRKEFALFILCAYCCIIALSSFTTMLAMLIPNITLSTVICIGLALALFYFTFDYQIGPLSLSEIFDADTIIGDTYYSAGSIDPYYVGGMRREISCFFLNFLPTGQIMEFYGLSNDYYRYSIALDNINPYIMLGGNAFFTAAPIITGLYFFRKKNLN